MYRPLVSPAKWTMSMLSVRQLVTGVMATLGLPRCCTVPSMLLVYCATPIWSRIVVVAVSAAFHNHILVMGLTSCWHVASGQEGGRYQQSTGWGWVADQPSRLHTHNRQLQPTVCTRWVESRVIACVADHSDTQHLPGFYLCTYGAVVMVQLCRAFVLRIVVDVVQQASLSAHSYQALYYKCSTLYSVALIVVICSIHMPAHLMLPSAVQLMHHALSSRKLGWFGCTRK
jgi:hypothetical protein